MHVLQLGPFPPPEGGVSRNLVAIRDALIRRGHSCSVVATTKGGGEHNEPGVYRPGSPLSFLKILSSLNYDLLHLHIGGAVSKRVLAMALACTVLGRGPAVLTLHSGAFPQTPAARAARPFSIQGAIFRRFARIIAVNEALAGVFRRYGVSAGRLSVILPYVLTQPDENLALREDLQAFYATHSPVLLAVGGLEAEYDPLFQIAAMRKVLEMFPAAGLMLVGDGSMRDEVNIAAAESGYRGDICIAGNVDHAQTLHLIRDADVLVRTTLFDGDAISIREALHLGTQVVATDNDMRPDGVHLIKTGDAQAFVNAIETAVGNKRTSSVEAEGDVSGINAVCDIYEKLLGRRAA